MDLRGERPALIARCTGVNDVVACANFSRVREVLISVRGRGHNYAGKAVCDDGLVIDLSLMKGIRVDQARRTVRAQAGLRLGELDRETQKFGLATTLGVNTDTGTSGLTLGGGYGWFAVKHGLSCDNVDVVSKKQSSAVLSLVTLRVLMARGTFLLERLGCLTGSTTDCEIEDVVGGPGPTWPEPERSCRRCGLCVPASRHQHR